MSGQLVYYPPQETAVLESVPARRIDPLHGFTLADLDRIARFAARANWMMGTDADIRYEEAYSAACEFLVTAPEPPSGRAVVDAAMNGIRRCVHEEMRQHGYRDYGSTAAWGPGSMPAWVKYWRNPRHAPSPEDIVTDRVAVTQILPRLTGRQRQALEALAAYGDHRQAAQAMGITAKTFGTLLAQGRRRFETLWHEGEKPPRPRRPGYVRGTSSRVLRECGSEAAYFRHWRNREDCEECQQAQSERRKARRAA